MKALLISRNMDMNCWQAGLVAVLLVAASAAPVRATDADQQYQIAVRQYNQARRTDRAEDWQQAIVRLRQFLGEHGRHARAAQATLFLAESLHTAGHFQQARQQYQTFLDQYLDRMPLYEPWARFRIGETAYLAGDYDRAEPLLQAYQHQFPNDRWVAHAQTYLGNIARQRGQGQAAVDLFRQALTTLGTSAAADPAARRLKDEATYGMARATQQQGDLPTARKLYSRLVDEPSGWLADQALYDLASIEYQAGNLSEVDRLLVSFQARFPRSRLRTKTRYLLGLTRIARQQYHEAADVLRQADPNDPAHPLSPSIAYYTGEALRRAGEAESARAQFRRVLATWPNSSWVDDSLYAEMQLALDADDHDTVKQLSDQLTRRCANSPRRLEARRILVRSLLKQQKYDQAVEQFQTSVNQVETNDPTGHLADADRYQLGLALIGAGRYDEALPTLRSIAPEGQPPEWVGGLRVARARALIGLDRFAQAVPDLRAYLKSQPHGPDAATCRALLVVALARDGKLQDAFDAHKQLSQNHPDDPQRFQAAMVLAQAAESAQKKRLARQLYASLTEEGVPEPYALKGRLGLLRTDIPGNDSTDQLQQLVREHPELPELPAATLARARSLLQAGQADDALELFRLYLDRWRDSQDHAQAVLGTARAYQQLEQSDQAIRVLEEFAQRSPHDKSLDAVRYEWAELLRHCGKTADAISQLALLHDNLPHSRYWAQATYQLAEAAMASEDRDRAARLVEELINSDAPPTVTQKSLYLRGQIAAQAEDFDTTVASMRSLLKLSPDDSLRVAAEYWIAEALYRQGKYADAKQQLDKLAALAQDQSPAWLAMVPLRQAQVLAHQGQWSDALALAGTIAKRFPSFRQQYEVDYLRGRCLAQLGRFAEARRAYKQVTESPRGAKTETAAMAQWMIGETYFHQKDYAKAIPAYLRVEILYDCPEWQAGGLLQAGKCREAETDYQAAIDLYARLISQYSGTRFGKEASRRLRIARSRLRATGKS